MVFSEPKDQFIRLLAYIRKDPSSSRHVSPMDVMLCFFKNGELKTHLHQAPGLPRLISKTFKSVLDKVCRSIESQAEHQDPFPYLYRIAIHTHLFKIRKLFEDISWKPSSQLLVGLDWLMAACKMRDALENHLGRSIPNFPTYAFIGSE